MKIVPFSINHFDECCELFVESTYNSSYYTSMFSDVSVRKNYIKNVVLSNIDYILADKNSWCAIDNNTVMGFIWNLDYMKLLTKPEQLGMIFSGTPYATDNKYFNRIHTLATKNKDTLYIFKCLVNNKYKNQGIEKLLIDQTILNSCHKHFISDVSTEYLFSNFRELHFKEISLESDYLLFYR